MIDDTFLPTTPENWADAITYHRNMGDMERANEMLAEGKRLWPEADGCVWSRFRFLAWRAIT